MMNFMINSHENRGKIHKEYFVLALMFLMSMNFMGAFFYLALLFFIVSIVFFGARLPLEFSPFFLVLLGLSFVFFAPDVFGRPTSMIRQFVFFFCWMASWNLMRETNDVYGNEHLFKFFVHSIISVGAGSLVHLFLNVLINCSNSSLFRDTYDFWTREPMSATLQIANACIGLAIAISVLFLDTKRWMKITSIFVILIIFGYNLILAGRTILVTGALIALIAFLYKLSFSKHAVYRIRLFLVIALAIGVILFLYNLNIFGIKRIIEESSLYVRFEAGFTNSSGGRIDHKLAYIENLKMSVWGGRHIRQYYDHYAHDILLDTYDEAGIIAAVSIVFFLVLSLKHLFLFLRNSFIPNKIKHLTLCVYISVFLEFLVEPALLGLQWLVAVFCCIDAALVYINRYAINTKETSINHVYE